MKPYEFEQLVAIIIGKKAIAYRQLLLRMIMASMYLQRKKERRLPYKSRCTADQRARSTGKQ